MKWSNPFRRKKKGWVPTDQGMMNTSWDAGWWQQNLQPQTGGANEAVEACISTLAQTVSMCPIHHLSEMSDGEIERQKGSRPERVLMTPNAYSTRSQLFNTLIRSMYYKGDGYAVATRDGNGAIDKLYALDPRSVNPVLDPESGEVYYWASPNFGKSYNPETDNVYMSRDILHLRINVDPVKPLQGATPLTVAANAMAANSAITASQAAFFANSARPSGILSTPDSLNLEQMRQLREAYEARSAGGNAGGVPILGNGMKWEPMSLSSQDAQMIEAFQMTTESITRVFRVPLPLVNALQNSTFNNAEAMMSWFLASGLGFLLEHIELELNKLFNLPFDQRMNFDTKALLRSDWKSQIETLGEGVLKGIYAPNEARGMLGLKPVEDGDEPRVQQQVVPLSAWDMETPEPAPEVDVAASFEKGFAGA